MDVIRSQASRWFTAGLAVLAALGIARAVPASAQTAPASVDVGDQPIIALNVRGRGNAIVVRTWDRPAIQIEGDLAGINRSVVPFGGGRGRPPSQQIPPALFHERDGSTVAMAPEEFPFAGLHDGPHDVVRIDAPPGAHVTVTVPATTGVLYTVDGGGTTEIDGYRGANLVVFQRFGHVQIRNAVTTAFVQMNAGVVEALDSTFARVRVRTDAAHAIFERCRSTQIETSTVGGSILYDGGSFEPGLARFESQTGSIALGVASNAQVIGRSGDGRVITSFERRDANVAQQGNAATATIGGGGPLVNALSEHGNVVLYDGSLRTRRTVAPELRPLHQFLNAHRPKQQPPRPRREGR